MALPHSVVKRISLSTHYLSFFSFPDVMGIHSTTRRPAFAVAIDFVVGFSYSQTSLSPCRFITARYAVPE